MLDGTGLVSSMFWMMKRHLAGKVDRIDLPLKSRSDQASEGNACLLKRFAAHAAHVASVVPAGAS